MSEMARTSLETTIARTSRTPAADVHPAWLRLMEYCADLEHGEIEKLKIQNGLPMIAEVAVRKVKFNP